MDDAVKKKRGRKPKEPAPVGKSAEDTQPTENKTKRGRKPKYVYSAFDSGLTNNISEDENIIVKLAINDEMGSDTEEQPYAYNMLNYETLSNINEQIPRDTSPVRGNNNLMVVSLLKDFQEKNKTNEWPSNTSVCCYWCCHKFTNAPFGIPINYQHNKFNVYGCFCSLECASAYNFKSCDNIDEMWERYNLINLLSRKLGMSNIVKPAPDKLSLKMFGGFLDIDTFRSYMETNKIININFPPMTSVTQQIEEVNEYELNSDFKYIPLDTDRINKYKEKVNITRKKALANKSTLETSMNLKYS